MVDLNGNWTPEKDYSTYPPEKWCDCDRVANEVIKSGYSPKTSVGNIVCNIFALYIMEDGSPKNVVQNCLELVRLCGGFEDFDFYC